MTAAALIAASFAAAPAGAAQHSDYQAQMNRDPYYSGQNRDYGDENPAFTLGCPRGSIPESFPNALGRRCALPGGGYSY
jgi:hypothetical protein